MLLIFMHIFYINGYTITTIKNQFIILNYRSILNKSIKFIIIYNHSSKYNSTLTIKSLLLENLKTFNYKIYFLEKKIHI